MTVTQHTPGEWNQSYKNALGQYTVGTLNRCIATVHANSIDDQEAEANAFLIAAAPRMLATLGMALDAFLTDRYDETSHHVMALRTVIAAATEGK